MRWKVFFFGVFLLSALAGSPLAAGEWPAWRGPGQDGVSPETGLISRWSPAGENVVWRADLVGRSTPVVFDGRVCANGRVGQGLHKQEIVACWDAGSGKKLWEHRLDVYLTMVPFNRVGWANVVGDPETGNLYAHGVGGLLVAFDRAGKVVWSRELTEEFGLYSGFGGRTHSPMIDEDRLILSFVNTGWGEQGPPRHRTFAFDKRTGDLLWTSTPGSGNPYDLNTSTTPVAAVIPTSNGPQRLLIEGNADGWVHAIKARTGEKVWSFQLTKAGINITVAVAGDTVYASHSEENVDTPGIMGRLVAIDATGTGDVTKTHERWRADELGAGFSSPLVHDGTVYIIDNSANLFALDAKTGRHLWKHKLGTVGKGSPVWADGKIYVTELNGRVYILKPGPDGVQVLDTDEITVADATEGPAGRYAELYGSPAVAYGRVYLSTEAGLFCLGDKSKPFKAAKSAPVVLPEPPVAQGAAPAVLQVVPAEVLIQPGQTVRFTIKAFDSQGRALPAPAGAEWTLQGLAGKLDGGAFTPDPGKPQAGKVTAKVGTLEAAARVRVIPPLPWSYDFEAVEVGKTPPWWIGAGLKFPVKEMDGGKVLSKPPVAVGLDRSDVYLGPATLANYTIQADLLGGIKGRKRPDLGLVNSGYHMDLMGNHQKIQIRGWESDLRLEKSVPFPWDPDVWYTMKFRVDQQGDKALLRGKVWRRGEPEPQEWTITAEDPQPVRQGSPGIYGYSAAEIYYDNLQVTGNQP
ncbi:MAG TPA: PQQ-binding-like beta-propeller repeat protein [Thermoanaerobaculia bacterium]|nr:PQQ-binding-like beta-propeller repeat protein [Thermoanaerobaculia bacterium]